MAFKDPIKGREYSKKYQREWRLANPAKRREQAKRWRKKFPERHRAQQRNWRSRNRNKTWAHLLWTTHRMLALEYYLWLAFQKGVCAICNLPENKIHFSNGKIARLSVDHDHECCPTDKSCGKCTRGLLCHSCNAALGGFRDDPKILAQALKYLA